MPLIAFVGTVKLAGQVLSTQPSRIAVPTGKKATSQTRVGLAKKNHD